MEQRVLLADAERGDEAIDRLPHRVSANAQRAIVPRGISGDVDATCVKHLELEQLPLDVLRDALVAHALKDLAQDQISQRQALPIERSMQPVRLRIRNPSEVIDPDGGIDDDHSASARHPTLTRHPEIAFPGHLPAQAPDAPLPTRLDQQA